MDLEAKIKEEPGWIEGETMASLENFEHVSEVIALKEEVKSELTEPGSTQENSLEENFEHISEVIALKEEVKSELTESGSIQENSLENFEGSSMMTMDDIALDDDGALVDLVQESDTVTPASSKKSVMNQPPQKEGTSIRKRKKVSPEDQVLASASQVLASMSASAVDSEEAFANYIACELRQIKNKRVKILTKQKIQNLLTEALLEEIE